MSKQEENVFNIQILASHISLSHYYSQSIKPQTLYKLYLFKGQKNCSEINQYKNRLIAGKVFTGKILFNQLTFQFTVKTNKTDKEIINYQFFEFQDQDEYSLKLFQIKKYSNSQKLIASYELQIQRYIHQFVKNDQNYFFQQGQMDQQIYLTYQFFIAKNKATLKRTINQEKTKQKQKIKQKIIYNLQNKRIVSKHSENSNQQIEQQIRVLKHLSSDGKKLSINQKDNYQTNKIDAIEQLHKQQKMQRNKKFLKINQDEDFQLSLQNSQIQILEQIDSANMKSPNFTKSKKGKKFKTLMKFDQSPLQININQTQSQQISLENDSNVQTGKQKSQNKQSFLGSQLSLNNEFQEYLLNFVSAQNRNMMTFGQNRSSQIIKSKILNSIDYAHQNELITTRIPIRETFVNKNSNSLGVSEITLKQQSTLLNQRTKTKFRIIAFIFIVLILITALINGNGLEVFFHKLFKDNKNLIKRNNRKNHKYKIKSNK